MLRFGSFILIVFLTKNVVSETNSSESLDGMEDDIFTDFNAEMEDYSLELNNSSMCGNTSMLEHMMNVTQHRGLLHGFSK